MKYKNPIISGFYPDPSICRVSDDYFLVNSSFEYLPGVPIFHSKDLINWEQVGYCITRPSQINMKGSKCSGGIFAPTIRYNHGTFYMITTNIMQGNFILKTNNPKGEWSDPIWIDKLGIDPSLFWDDDKVYVQLATRDEEGCGISQFEIDIETGEILSECKVITRGCGGRDVEAPHMYKINGYYYLMLAEGGTREGHMVTIMRSESIWGPYETCPHNPILSNRDSSNEEIQGVGHGDLIQDQKRNWWMVALGYRGIKHKHVLGRETLLVPVKWNEEGWPVVHKGYAECVIDAEVLPQCHFNLKPAKDNFDCEKLGYEWNTMREFINEKYSLSDKKGSLCLKGDYSSLNGLEASAYIARRQQHFDCKFLTKIDFTAKTEKEEAGLAIYMDNEHHMELVITRRNNKRVVVVRKNISDIKVETVLEIIEEKDIFLEIKADRSNYIFSYGYDDNNMKVLDMTVTKHLSTEVANSAFTGVYCGMYATGNGSDMKHILISLFINHPKV